MRDKTSKIEDMLKQQSKPSIKYLLKLWLFVFSSTKAISSIYLGLFIILSLLRPFLALVWKNYIVVVEGTTNINYIWAIVLLISYWAINFLAGLIESYMAVDGDGDIEQLDAVQANRQQELMHTKIFGKINAISFECFEIPRLNDEVQKVFDFIGNPVSGVNREVMLSSYILIAKIISLITIAISLYLFNPWLSILLILAPLPMLWTSSVGEKMRFKFDIDNSEKRRVMIYFQELLLTKSCKEIKSLGLHNFFYNKWKNAADEYTTNEKVLMSRKAFINIADTMFTNTVNIGGMIFVIVLMAKGEISLGVSAAVLSLIGTIVKDSAQLMSGLSFLLSKKHEAHQFSELMAIPELLDQGNNIDSFQKLTVHNIKYRYPLTDKYVLDKVSFCINKGEKIAFIGINGEGKTTMVKLLTGLLSPSEGVISFDNNEIETLNPLDRFRIQSTVMQDPAQYTTFTIYENVYLGDVSKQEDKEEIGESLSFAGLGSYDPEITLGKEVGGGDLSGGEWQKLAIARAAYRNKDFIILDEPTSNLDPLAETEIFMKYIDMSENKTVIFVTHRISLASLANRILVFKNGKIVQDGSHRELINQPGEYAHLYREQAKWYDG